MTLLSTTPKVEPARGTSPKKESALENAWFWAPLCGLLVLVYTFREKN